MSEATQNLMQDVPRGMTSRYLRQQAVPQARWQDPADLLKSPALAYDPGRPGAKI